MDKHNKVMKGHKAILPKINWVSDDNLKDYSKELYFIEKNTRAAEFLTKHCLPEFKKKGKK